MQAFFAEVARRRRLAAPFSTIRRLGSFLPPRSLGPMLRSPFAILPPYAPRAMGFLNRLFGSPPPSIGIGDCLSRKVVWVSEYPVVFSSKGADSRQRASCRIERRRRKVRLFPPDGGSDAGTAYLDGAPLSRPAKLEPGRPYAFALRRHLLLLQPRSDNFDPDGDFETGCWEIAPRSDPEQRKRYPKAALHRRRLQAEYPEPDRFLAFPGSFDCGFPLSALLPLLPASETAPAPETRFPSFGEDAAGRQDRHDGRHTCPLCWKTFEAGEAMNIAAHDALYGDEVLGPDARRRFRPTRFNDLGQALDPRGVVSVDMACPHCRGRLPPSFLSQPHRILSLVGAPSSGKSYYLAILLGALPAELYRHFGCLLLDADPTGNLQLDEMKNRLLSATTSEDAFISKTDFEGLMYDRLPRNGKLVSLPRPFVYTLQKSETPDRRLSLVFYDNAGEHFKPAVSLDDSPGALHVAASSALLFLFDPATSQGFRKRLRRRRDPQLRSQATDEQETILAEMGVRVKKLRGLENHEKVDTPLAIIIGKFDMWRSLLPESALACPEDCPLSPEETAANSQALRQLLLELAPMVVANAEAISSNTCYFAVSPLGHSPKEIPSGPLAGKLSPNPARLRPVLASSPVLWALRQLAPELLDKSPRAPAFQEKV